MNRMLAGWAGGLSLALAGCASQTASIPVESETVNAAPVERVLLIGLDGMRHDYLELYEAPNLQALADRGVQADAMIPVMPSKTFVNFYSIATGLYPENHGMTDNAPYDTALGEGFVNATSTQDPFWWGGEPIWITAEKAGLPTAVMFWLGSEVELEGHRPTRWTPYQHDKPYQERVDEVLAWFDGPVQEQPRFAAVYFDRVDSVGHGFGPETPEVQAAVTEVDGYVGQILAGLEARGLLETTNVLVVSDHGMARIDPDALIAIDQWIDFDTIYSPTMEGRWGASPQPYVNIFGDPDAIEAAYQALEGVHPHLRVWKKGEMPDHYHFDHPTRGPDLFVLADAGWSVTAPSLAVTPRAPIPGNHGYDNHDPVMGALFVAAGPRFEAGVHTPAFENVNLYGVMACALGLEPAQTDGDPAVIAALTQDRCPAQ